MNMLPVQGAPCRPMMMMMSATSTGECMGSGNWSLLPAPGAQRGRPRMTLGSNVGECMGRKRKAPHF